MMKNSGHKKIIIKVSSQEQQENLKNTRKTLKVLQHTATDKENLVGRPRIDKDSKALESEKHDAKRKKMIHRGVQTGEATITEADLTSDEPNADYWRVLAEKRGEALNDSFKENEKLKDKIEVLEEENTVIKEMLEESKTLVEVLQEMIGENDQNTTELGEEATETTSD